MNERKVILKNKALIVKFCYAKKLKMLTPKPNTINIKTVTFSQALKRWFGKKTGMFHTI